MILSEKYRNLTFFRQKIVRKEGVRMIDGIEEYELLLRYNGGNQIKFPNELFEIAIVDHSEHKNYTKKLGSLLEDILQNTSAIYSINIDTQELYYEETIFLFEDLKQYSKKLKIELTENLPFKREGEYSRQFPLEQVVKLHKLGFEIVLDDFLSGINGVDKLIMLSPFISRVKISKLVLGPNFSDTMFCSFVFAADKLVKKINPNLSFVIEAEEKEEILEILSDDWYYQTYYFDKPSIISPN